MGLLGTLSLGACASFGHNTLPTDRFNYNAAITQSRNEQMLTNLVRMRYIEVPEFLAVSSVITNYRYDRGLGLKAATGFQGLGDDSTYSGNANLGFSERPTITYAPLAGQEFSRQMLTPIPVEGIFSLGQAGWAIDILLAVGLQKINNVQNMSFGQIPDPGDLDRGRQFARDRERLRKFQRIIKLFLVLTEKGGMELQRRQADPSPLTFLIFNREAPAETQALINEFKQALGLDPERHAFRVTNREAGRADDEITIQSRSLLAIMSFLARGIDVPEEHRRRRYVVVVDDEGNEDAQPSLPLKVHSQKERPEDAFVAIQYQGYWFYVNHADITSKRTFALLIIMFQFQAPTATGAAPLLTLPTGR